MKILLAEGDPTAREMVISLLEQWGFDVIAVEDGLTAWSILQGPAAPGMVILDRSLPGMGGMELCRAVRSGTEGPYIYVILLTGLHLPDDLVEGMDAGADDFIRKPFDPRELQSRVRAGQRIVNLQEGLIAARELRWYQATHDDLTGTWNRKEILGILDRELIRGRRDRIPVGVIMVDVDKFKGVNDRYGHMAGDEVLKRIAYQMQCELRPYDSLGRYGGEEFIAVLPGCDLVESAAIAERLRESIGRCSIDITPNSQMRHRGRGTGTVTLRCTISLGVASWSEEQDPDVETLVRAADGALYRAKDERNRVEVAISGESVRGAPPGPPPPVG